MGLYLGPESRTERHLIFKTRKKPGVSTELEIQQLDFESI